MLTIRPCKAFSKALGEYLRQADYYAHGMKVEGHCQGQLCAAVGLVEGASITDEAFERVAANRNALSDEQLTERMAAGRRAGYDAVFNAPKSVSIQAFVGGDERLIVAHETVVREAFDELESFARHQTGRGLNKRHVASGGIAAAVFRHGESRALDPHLHSHAFIFNVTQNAAGRFMALESSAIFENTRYLTEVYRNALAREVQRLGYAIERREHGFELVGISSDLLERFSKRAQECDAAIKLREAELGRELTRDEIALLVRENRAAKQYELKPDQVRQRQLAQVNENELEQLQALKSGAQRSVPSENVSLNDALGRAAEHLFERRTVVSEQEFIAAVLREGYGGYSLAEVKAAVATDGRLLRVEGQISTQAALDLERGLIARLNAGVGRHDGGIGFVSYAESDHLSGEQRHAVNRVLDSRDSVTVLRGRAGTGKTQTLATLIEGVTRFDCQVACFTPSTQAVEILREDGQKQVAAGRSGAGQALSSAHTVQRLLVDEALQQSLKHSVLVVDEYGLLSTRQLAQLVDIAEKQKARLLLVGDSGQHKSVEAGDAARIIERESRVRVVNLSEVHRQAVNPAYKAAAEDLAVGRLASGLKRLDRMGAVVEIESPVQRHEQMVEEWLRAQRETKQVRTTSGLIERAKTALMVAPTWAEIDQLNAVARHQLRADQKITGEEKSFASLRAKDWTRAQQKDIRNYQPGDVLVAHKTTKHFQKNEEMRVVRKAKGRLVITSAAGERSVSVRQSGRAWTVCEERKIPIAAGDRLRLRAIGQAVTSSGEIRRLANGATVTVASVNAAGQPVLADNSTLLTRQVAYGYALTSHASQGVTVDKVFLAGAASREGLYVSATRGRESVHIFVPDRREFLDAAGLRSEARTSALEFARHLRVREGLLSHLARAWVYLQQVRTQVSAYLTLHPEHSLVESPEAHRIPVRPKPSQLQQVETHYSPSEGHNETPSQSARMRL
ncbi:MAG: relaxase domain-containing protein [Opitutaceae bacterium]|nr:relaxase domain-containing protein [Opitutaceae bacterium]